MTSPFIRTSLLSALALLALGATAFADVVVDRYKEVNSVDSAQDQHTNTVLHLSVAGKTEAGAALAGDYRGSESFSGNGTAHLRALEKCERYAVLLMNKPGKFILRVEFFGPRDQLNGNDLKSCGLERAP